VLTSLSMSGYRFKRGNDCGRPWASGTVTPISSPFGPLSFGASFVLANHTTIDIDFMVPRPVVPMGSQCLFMSPMWVSRL